MTVALAGNHGGAQAPLKWTRPSLNSKTVRTQEYGQACPASHRAGLA